MTLEELAQALGIDGEETKDKFAVLKKEFNAKTKEVNTLTKKVETLEADVETGKKVSEKLDILSKAFDVDTSAEDLDSVIEESKEALIKSAGGGSTPDEVKNLKRDLTKISREKEKALEQITELTEKLTTEKTERINGNKRTAIQKALTDNKIIKPEQMIDLFFNRVNVDDDGTTMTIKGSDGSELGISEAIADWASENPEFVQTGAKGGAGSGQSQGANAGGNGANSGVSELMQSVISNAIPGGGNKPSLGELFG